MKNEKKELARVEKRLREVIEARLERGDALSPWSYGVITDDNEPQLISNGCFACLLGSVVLDELVHGKPLRTGGQQPFEVAGDLLNINAARRDALEAGFMQWKPKHHYSLGDWYALGEQLLFDYYETTDPVGE